MIPKIIHYCWFGRNPLPKSAVKCIDSWKKFLPGYEIKEWNEDNFDVNMIPYTAEAYKARKYAFVSDYARFWILYHYGGVYFDTDVEVIRPMEDILAKGAFMGCEEDSDGRNYPTVNPGLGMAVEKYDDTAKMIINLYERLIYSQENSNSASGIYKTVVQYTTEFLAANGLKPTKGIQSVRNIYIYPKEYFNPLEHINMLTITKNTRTIHHYAATWAPFYVKLYRTFVRLIGPKIYGSYIHFRNRLSKQ